MALPGTEYSTTPAAAGIASMEQRWATLLPHRDSVVRLARSRGAGADAEDVAQEALLRTASQPGLDLSRAKSYLTKVAVNLVIDLHRRTAKEQVLRNHAGLVPRPQSAQEEVENRELGRLATRLISDLAPQLRSILLLRRDGATWSQVGAKLGKSAATAEIRYRRAMLPLRQQLGLNPSEKVSGHC